MVVKAKEDGSEEWVTVGTGTTNAEGGFTIALTRSVPKGYTLRVECDGVPGSEHRVVWYDGLPNGGKRYSVTVGEGQLSLDGSRRIVGAAGAATPGKYVTLKKNKRVAGRGPVASDGSFAIDTNQDIAPGDVIEVTEEREYVTSGATTDYNHAVLVVREDGTVWGNADSGTPLGISSSITGYNLGTPPRQMMNMTDAVMAVTNARHTLVLRRDGTVWATGYNNYGQLGDGTTATRLTPVQVQGLTGVIDIAVGYGHSLALLSDGRVMAWGNNVYGQLGDGTTQNKLVPVEVQGITNAVAIAAGDYHSLALLADGRVMAWGYNGKGQLGDGTEQDKIVPVQAGGITNAVAVTAGRNMSCALLEDGRVAAWGDNDYYQLGLGHNSSPITVPTVVPNLTGARAVAMKARPYNAGKLTVLLEDGTVKESAGTQGMVTKAGLPTVEALAKTAGAGYMVVILRDGGVAYWETTPQISTRPEYDLW
ncbi:MAG: RCC1 domain-containing protein [Anaerolineae bacterium]